MAVLGPNLATTYVMRMTCRALEILDLESKRLIAEENYDLLGVMHHLTAGLKAICAEFVYVGVDALRQSCGGMGFLSNSGFVELWETITPYPTYEGVNVVMLQQSSRMLLKNAARVASGKKCKDFFEYLNHTEKLCSSKCQATSVDEFRDLSHI